MKNYFIKVLLLSIFFITVSNSIVLAQSRSVFLNLKLGQTTYQDAVNQIRNSIYGNYMKITDGTIFIIGTQVKQNNGKIWDHADIHFKGGYVNNIQLHSASASGHSVDYITNKYKELKDFFIPKNGYSFWYEKGDELCCKYYGVAALLSIFDSEVAGKVVRVQYIAL